MSLGNHRQVRGYLVQMRHQRKGDDLQRSFEVGLMVGRITVNVPDVHPLAAGGEEPGEEVCAGEPLKVSRPPKIVTEGSRWRGGD